MRIGVWEGGHLKDCAIGDLVANYNRSTWIDVADPTARDLEDVAGALRLPVHVLIGKLRSNYPHVDSYR